MTSTIRFVVSPLADLYLLLRSEPPDGRFARADGAVNRASASAGALEHALDAAVRTCARMEDVERLVLPGPFARAVGDIADALR